MNLPLRTVSKRYEQGTIRIQALKTPGYSFHEDFLAHADGSLQPGRADYWKPPALIPYFQPMPKAYRKFLQNRFWRELAPESRNRIRCARGGMGQVYAAAQGNAGWVCIHNLGQEPAEFGTPHENVIGPFQEKRGLRQKT